MEKLRISENGRYFVTESGKPFIWLADTVWTMPQRLKWDDAEYLMKKRKSQGFTVLQIVALDPERDLEMHNPAGVKALHEDDITKPNEEYFKYLDWILSKAEEIGLYVLLLPVWGQLVVGHSWSGETFPRTVTAENAFGYGEWIGARYKNRKNIIWCLGGDRQPIHLGEDFRDVWRRMAEGLAKGVLGKDLAYNDDREEWKELLITYHACHEMETGECSTMSYWTDEEAWIQFIMLQSGHGLMPGNYELVEKEYNRKEKYGKGRTMPVWDGEPAYEMMPTSWPITPETGFHGSWMVRKRAYWALFAGAFGHTYGHANVWCSVSEQEKNEISSCTWYEALDSEGSGQIKILRDFLESVPLTECEPAQELAVQDEDGGMDEHVQVTRHPENAFLCAYLPSGGSCTLRTEALGAECLYGWWFNPRDGKCYDKAGAVAQKPFACDGVSQELTFTAPEAGAEKDWVLLLYTKETSVPVTEGVYGEEKAKVAAKKVFEW